MKRKVKFNQARGSFKKGQVIEVSEEIALQLMGTGPEGSVEDAAETDKVTSRNAINAQIKEEQAKKVKVLRAKAEEAEK